VAHFANVGRAFSNIGNGLRPGGRIVFVEWLPRQDNEWMTLPASILRTVTKEREASDSPDNSAFGSPDRLETMLHLAGFESLEIERVEAQMWIGSSGEDVLQWFLGLPEGKVIDGLPETQRVAFGEEFGRAMRQRTDSTGVHVKGSAWIVKALKPDAS
jgi:SAM-dependent methyltransferase